VAAPARPVPAPPNDHWGRRLVGVTKHRLDAGYAAHRGDRGRADVRRPARAVKTIGIEGLRIESPAHILVLSHRIELTGHAYP
jgi:hypothetical protein